MARTADIPTRSIPRVKPRQAAAARPPLLRRIVETPAWRRDEQGALWVSLPVGAGIVALVAIAAFPVVDLIGVALDWFVA